MPCIVHTPTRRMIVFSNTMHIIICACLHSHIMLIRKWSESSMSHSQAHTSVHYILTEPNNTVMIFLIDIYIYIYIYLNKVDGSVDLPQSYSSILFIMFPYVALLSECVVSTPTTKFTTST